MNTKHNLSEESIILLKFSKLSGPENKFHWKRLQVLLEEYRRHQLSFGDVFHFVCATFEQVKADDRFCTPNRFLSLSQMLLEPLKYGADGKSLFGATLDQSYTTEQFYQAFINSMMTSIRLTRVDWCKEEIWGISKEEVIPS